MKMKFGILMMVLVWFSAASTFAVEYDAHVKAYRNTGDLNGRNQLEPMARELPDDLIRHSLEFLPNQVLEGINKTLRECAYKRDQAKWRAKVLKIERLFKKYNQDPDAPGFIPLPGGGEIAKSGIDQELWVTVMGNNPSRFNKRVYCPDTYKEVTIQGQVIPMCPDLPVERIVAESNGRKDSDEELIKELNRTYENAGLTARFRRHTPAEYHYADTANNTENKAADDDHLAQLGQCMPYSSISNQSPSGRPQSRSIFNNAPNSLGFRRSGVSEWGEDLGERWRNLVGGSWRKAPEFAASGNYYENPVDCPQSDIGPSRLVRTE